MKIQNYNDLHIEFQKYNPNQYTVADDTDVIVLAGDIGAAPKGTYLWIKNTFGDRPVVFVTGNHEYYRSDITEINDFFQEKDDNDPNFHFLNDSWVKIDGVTFVGGTLWTDMGNDNPLIKMYVQNEMNDFAVITHNFADGGSIPTRHGTYGRRYGKLLTANDTVKFHKRTLATIIHVLEKIEGPIVVVTHHAPHEQCVQEWHKDDWKMNCGYKSDLDWVFQKYTPVLWYHGHMHADIDFVVNKTRIVCNAYGYHKREAWKNDTFDHHKVIKI